MLSALARRTINQLGMNSYVKLRDLTAFTVMGDNGYSYKKWNQAEGKMEISDKWQEGFRKMFSIETDQGTLDLSQAQLGQMLASAYRDGAANIIGNKFNVKTNGKTGMEIRYFINLDHASQAHTSPETRENKKDEVVPTPTPTGPESASNSFDELPF